MARRFNWVNCVAVAAALIATGTTALILILPNSACTGLTVPADRSSRVADGKSVNRELPRRFPRNTNLPPGKEFLTSGAIDTATFNPTQDLVRFQSMTVWFESDYNKESNDNDDHIMHRSVVAPLERLVRLVDSNKGRLKVHEAYRCSNIHKPKSLHREGRALDLTCEGLSLSDLAKLCWVAGFDWVLYESPRGGGDHVHCSVKR